MPDNGERITMESLDEGNEYCFIRSDASCVPTCATRIFLKYFVDSDFNGNETTWGFSALKKMTLGSSLP